MGISDWLLGFFKAELAPVGTKTTLTACNVSAAHLQLELDGAKSKLEAANSALNACEATGSEQQQAIAKQSSQIQTLSDEVATLTAQVAASASLSDEPCPPLLQEVPASKVMLGDFIIRTMSGTYTCTIPNHPSCFQPGPFYDFALQAAGCDDITHGGLTEEQEIMAIANACMGRMTYRADNVQWGRADNWTPPQDAAAIGGDDCETEAANIVSALLWREQKWGVFKKYSIHRGLGHLVEGTESYGHGFVLIISKTSTSLDDSFFIEATLSHQTNLLPFSTGKANYTMDWGIDGYYRKAHPEGSYLVQDAFAWWNSASRRVMGAQEGLLERIKVKLRLKKHWKERRRDAIKRIWEKHNARV